MDGFTDIRRTGWVRHLPPGWVPYAILARFDRLIGAWLLFLPGLWSIPLAHPPFWGGLTLLILFAAGAIVMRGAGCVVNDLWDRKMDASVERTRSRPLASGALTPFQALVFLAGLCLIGLLILLQLNISARILGLLILVPVCLYPLAKRVTWWPQAVLGIVFGWAAPMGYAAAAGSLGWPALPLYAAAFLWIVAYDTVYAHQDSVDDALIGIRSSALRLGGNTQKFLAACYAGMMVLLIIAMAGAGIHALGFWCLLLPAGMLARQVVMLDITNPARCLAQFRQQREVGLAVGLAILAGLL
jgi:4-hydroxybenzoate polyprenyltransferase